MKGKWKVTKNPMMETNQFCVIRIIDTSKPDHSGNREYYSKTWYATREEAQVIVDQLNMGVK